MATDEALPSFGVLLRQHRLQAGLTQAALAERADLSERAVQHLERGLGQPYRETARRLAEALALAAEERAGFEAAAAPARRRRLAPAGRDAPLKAPARSLPEPPTALIGREAEVRAAVALLRQDVPPVRLLTLTGPGGVGKTRLALAVAATLADAYPDGVVFVDLAPVRDPRLVPATIAYALAVRESGGRSARELLLAHLRERHLLLVLDNLEHLPGAAPLLAELLEGCPRLALLATSRAALHLRAEQRLAVEPLATPAEGDVPLDEVAAAPAVRLFADRARAAAPAFVLEAGNAGAVAAICRRLDGIPLALELAAARVPLLSAAALVGRLERRLPLPSGPVDLPERQQTLRAALSWSHDLLGPAERALFRRLAAFAGGCTLEAAEAVCADAALPADEVVERLQALVDNSLVQRTVGAEDEPRVGMLETVREYALERLEAGGEAGALRRRHAEYYLALAEAVAPRILGPEQVTWLDRLDAERDNLRAALAWSQDEAGDAETALRLATAQYRFWHVRGHLSEGREWLGLVLARDAGRGTPDAARVRQLRAKALNGAAVLARAQGSYTAARSLFEESLMILRESGDRWGTANALHNLGSVALYQGEYDRATALLEDSLVKWRELGDRWGLATALHYLGQATHYQGDHRRADAVGEESLALFRGIGDVRGIAMVLRNLASVAYARDDDDRAATLYDACLPLYRDLRDTWSIALTLHGMADVAHRRGDHGRAAELYRESLVLRREQGDRRGAAESLEGLASLAAAQDRPERAAQLFGAAEALRAAIGAPLPPRDHAIHQRDLAIVRTKSGEAAFAAAWAAGQAMSLEQAIAYALETPAPT